VVTNVLTKLQVPHQRTPNIKGLFVDASIDNSNVLLEAMGPADYLRGSQKLVGQMQFKHRLLRKMGLQVNVINTTEKAPDGPVESQIRKALGLEGKK